MSCRAKKSAGPGTTFLALDQCDLPRSAGLDLAAQDRGEESDESRSPGSPPSYVDGRELPEPSLVGRRPGDGQIIFYLALPPSVFEPVTAALRQPNGRHPAHAGDAPVPGGGRSGDGTPDSRSAADLQEARESVIAPFWALSPDQVALGQPVRGVPRGAGRGRRLADRYLRRRPAVGGHRPHPHHGNGAPGQGSAGDRSGVSQGSLRVGTGSLAALGRRQ